MANFNPTDKRQLKQIWGEFEKSTKLTPSPPSDVPSEKGQEIAAALMVSFLFFSFLFFSFLLLLHFSSLSLLLFRSFSELSNPIF